MNKNDYYKIFQLSDVFIRDYGFNSVVLKNFVSNIYNENWLFNKKDKNYQLIRITLASPDKSSSDEQIKLYLDYFESTYKISDIKFLDIHICKDEYNENVEIHDFINIDEDYYVGIDLKNVYPKIYKCIHHVDDADKEVKTILDKINSKYKRRKNIFNVKTKDYICTLVLIGICIVNYLLRLFLQYKYDDLSSVYIVCGADYKTFTLGLKQFYRLITYSFVHGDILHLLCNMISLYSIGRYIEIRFGHTRFLLITFYSILIGGLTQGILIDNAICLGMSAGIYGLMVVFIGDMLTSKFIDLRILAPTILINISLNFLSTTAWAAHLGGAIGGFVIYYYLRNEKDYPRLGLCILLFLCLTYKYVTIDSIKSLYGGTDLKILNIYEDLGFKNYSNKLFNKLLDVYSKFGG